MASPLDRRPPDAKKISARSGWLRRCDEESSRFKKFFNDEVCNNLLRSCGDQAVLHTRREEKMSCAGGRRAHRVCPLPRANLAQNDRWYVDGLFDRFVTCGEVVEIDRTVLRTRWPIFRNQKGVIFGIFSTSDPKPVSGLRALCSLMPWVARSRRKGG